MVSFPQIIAKQKRKEQTSKEYSRSDTEDFAHARVFT
jgi:hypothetical protein